LKQDTTNDKETAAWIWGQRSEKLADTMVQFRLEFDWDGGGEAFWEGLRGYTLHDLVQRGGAGCGAGGEGTTVIF